MATIEDYIKEIKAASDKYWKRSGFTLSAPEFHYIRGKRYYKVMESNNGSNRVHCFVEIESGDILKAASYNLPAKGVRGNINDDKKPLLCGDYYRYL